MKRRAGVFGSLRIALFCLVCATLMALPVGAQAQPKIVTVEGVSYNVNATMADNLKSLVGKRVYVTLDSGKTFTGNVKEVGGHLLHLEKLEGKDYFDALIVLENISAIDTRFRTDQR